MLFDRRHEVSRLVVSLDVPRSYDELVRTMRGFPSFGCCFALLAWIWHEHNMFFRRDGLQDGWTVLVNCMLLFVTQLGLTPLEGLAPTLFARMGPLHFRFGSYAGKKRQVVVAAQR